MIIIFIFFENKIIDSIDEWIMFEKKNHLVNTYHSCKHIIVFIVYTYSECYYYLRMLKRRVLPIYS